MPVGTGFGSSLQSRFSKPVTFLPTMPDLLSEITQTAKAYYAQASAVPLTATDFYDWLESLPTARKAEVIVHGFRAGRTEPGFLRFCLEWRGYDMWGFMAARLSVEAFTLWTNNGEFNGDLPPNAISR